MSPASQPRVPRRVDPLHPLPARPQSSPESARRGIFLGELGMFVAVVATLLHKDIVSYEWIIAGLIVGSGIGHGDLAAKSR